MPKAKDLTGQQFGNWLVLYRAENKNREVMWHCRCSCGNESDVNAKSLIRGKSLSCVLCKTNTTNIVGKMFGKLLVISQIRNMCHCLCKNCGNEVDYTVRDLISGRHKSCSCLVHKNENLVGQKFGNLLALEKMYDKYNNVGYLCRCDCGNEKFYLAYKLRNGLVKSCGECYSFKGEDLTGQRFGHWTIESFSHKNKNGVYYWNCVCDCEAHTHKKVSVKSLKQGLSKSCGCQKKGTKLQLYGTKIGKWTILDNVDTLRWNCVCECGTEKIVHYSNIQQGLSQSCGCSDIAHKGSKEENEIKEYILSLLPNVIISKEKILDGKEIDLYMPEYNFGIEYNGSIFHSSINGIYKDLPKDYHFNKFLLAKEKGIHLISVFDVDWWAKKEKIKNIIKEILIPCNKIYGRMCEVQKIDKDLATSFLEKYHLQGTNKSAMKINLGLFYRGELLAVMVFSNIRYNKGNGYELYRYCVKSQINILGGASKLFKYFIRNYSFDKIVCYSDNDYFTGNIYQQLGFEFDGYTTLSYYWYLDNKMLPREKCQPKKLKDLYPKLYDEAIGGKENYIMSKLGAKKVYRCGNTRWIYRKEEV